MNVDVEIYMNNIIKFFRENPKDLVNLVPKEKEQDLYRKIKEIAYKNYERGEDIILTQSQIMKICDEINGSSKNFGVENINKVFYETIFGKICLN